MEAFRQKTIDKDSKIKGFSIEGMKIFIKDDEINVEYNGNLYNFTKEEFNRRPRGVMERILLIRKGSPFIIKHRRFSLVFFLLDLYVI